MQRSAVVAAEGFGLKGPRGWTFHDVTFSAPAGALVAIEGPSGSGRTCLLLALAGRMRATHGRAEIGGHVLPKQLAAARRLTALGPVAGVSELEPSLTVSEHLRERVLLQRRFSESLGGLLRPPGERGARDRRRIDEALAQASLDLERLPKGPRTAVRDLERLDALRLGTALAMLARPAVLAVDDADYKLPPAEREAAWAMLRGIAERGTTVLAVCSEAPEGAVTVRTHDNGTGNEKEAAADAHAEAGSA